MTKIVSVSADHLKNITDNIEAVICNLESIFNAGLRHIISDKLNQEFSNIVQSISSITSTVSDLELDQNNDDISCPQDPELQELECHEDIDEILAPWTSHLTLAYQKSDLYCSPVLSEDS